jgi:hypothetical protein
LTRCDLLDVSDRTRNDFVKPATTSGDRVRETRATFDPAAAPLYEPEDIVSQRPTAHKSFFLILEVAEREGGGRTKMQWRSASCCAKYRRRRRKNRTDLPIVGQISLQPEIGQVGTARLRRAYGSKRFPGGPRKRDGNWFDRHRALAYFGDAGRVALPEPQTTFT